jgi:hypothetical protein
MLPRWVQSGGFDHEGDRASVHAAALPQGEWVESEVKGNRGHSSGGEHLHPLALW